MFKNVTTVILLLTNFFITTFISRTAFAALTCSDLKAECIEEGGTRYFDGVAVTLGCWRYKHVYKCREKSDNNCKQLRDQGCSQVSAKCRTFVVGTCVVQDEVFRCPVEHCEEKGDIVCAEKEIFCVGGDCSPANPTKNNNFDKAASSLAALAAAAKEVESQNNRNPIIFAGHSMECSRNILPGITKDCCADNEGIFNCAEDEKELYQKRKEGLAIEVGEFCYSKNLGVCTSYHRAFCVFGSKMARIVQNDGRKNQLEIGFGSVGDDYAHLDCRGIKKEELSKMDFNKMDFSPLYADIRAKVAEKMPAREEIVNKSNSYSLEDLKKKSTKGISNPEFKNENKVLNRMKDFYDRVKK